jgi:hypothetical protein
MKYKLTEWTQMKNHLRSRSAGGRTVYELICLTFNYLLIKHRYEILNDREIDEGRIGNLEYFQV